MPAVNRKEPPGLTFFSSVQPHKERRQLAGQGKEGTTQSGLIVSPFMMGRRLVNNDKEKAAGYPS